MMQFLVYSIFVSLFFSNYLFELGVAPRVVKWLPDLLLILAAVVVVVRAVAKKGLAVGVVYPTLLFFLVLDIIFGIILNGVAGGVVFAGLRGYAVIALFFLPAVYHFSDDQLRRQLYLLLALTVFQLPVTLYQRLVQFAGHLSGDPISGTVKGSGHLTIYLLAAISVFTAFYLKQRLTKLRYFTFLVAMFLPTTLNETKVTIFFLPLALIVPVLFVGGGYDKIKKFSGVLLLAAALLAMFVPIYDHLMAPRYAQRVNPAEGIADSFSREGRLEQYLERSGRLGALGAPFALWSDDPTKFMLGLGIGNTQQSGLGEQFDGEYLTEYSVSTTLSRWWLEIGLLGLIPIVLIFLMVLRDSLNLRRGECLTATFALGWIGVLVVLGASLVYSGSVLAPHIAYLLWFYSGYMAASAEKIRLQMYKYSPA